MLLSVAVAITVLLSVSVIAYRIFRIHSNSRISAFHVQAVDYGTQVGELVAQAEIFEQGIVGFVGIVGAADINREVGHPCDDLCVGHHSDGSGVEHDIVEVLFQDIDGFHQCLACQQFGRFGGTVPPGRMLRVWISRRAAP